MRRSDAPGAGCRPSLHTAQPAQTALSRRGGVDLAGNVEQHRDQGGETAAAVLGRAIEHFASLGIDPPEAVMSDNAFAYRNSRAFKAVLASHDARHILTPPYTPRWNGKVERFVQTLKREWAYAHSWPNSTRRTRALPSFLRYYNRRRPHSSLGDRPPISRVHNVWGQDS